MFENSFTRCFFSKQQMHVNIFVLTLFAGHVHSQHCDGDVVLIGSHVLQHNRVQLSFKFTQVTGSEPFQRKQKEGNIVELLRINSFFFAEITPISGMLIREECVPQQEYLMMTVEMVLD